MDAIAKVSCSHAFWSLLQQVGEEHEREVTELRSADEASRPEAWQVAPEPPGVAEQRPQQTQRRPSILKSPEASPVGGSENRRISFAGQLQGLQAKPKVRHSFCGSVMPVPPADASPLMQFTMGAGMGEGCGRLKRMTEVASEAPSTRQSMDSVMSSMTSDVESASGEEDETEERGKRKSVVGFEGYGRGSTSEESVCHNDSMGATRTGDFVLADRWNQAFESCGDPSTMRVSVRGPKLKTRPTLGLVAVTVEDDEQSEMIHCCGCIDLVSRRLNNYVVHPSNISMFYFDCVSLALLVYEAATIPLRLFTSKQSSFMKVIYILSVIVWTLDLFRSFFVGYYRTGCVVLCAKSVARRYTKGWLAPDASLVVMNWALLLGLDSKWSEGGKSNTILNIFHGLRLLRVLKVIRLMRTVQDRIHSEMFSVIWTMTKLFVGILVLNHLAACCWYGIGSALVDTHPSWVTQYLDNAPVGDRMSYRYLTSFHWALTQFTPASISVQPCNSYERFFNVIILLFALVTVSTFVSGITASVMRLNALRSAQSKQFWLLRRYLKESSVPTPLGLRIVEYCAYVYQLNTNKVQEGKVEVLKLLSTSLRAELKTAIYEPRLQSHPFFVLIGKVAQSSLRVLCNTAISSASLGRGDHMFSSGQECKRLFYANDDSFWYLRFDVDCERVPEGTWLAEIGLWTTWSYAGTLQAKNESELMAMDVEFCGKALCGHPAAFEEAAEYGRAFLVGLNRVGLPDVTDLWQSPRREGLWMRLMNEFDVERRERGHGGGRGSMLGAWNGGSTIRTTARGSQLGSGISRMKRTFLWCLYRGQIS